MNEIYFKLMTVSENSINTIANETNTIAMTGKDWILLIIPSIISLIGLMLTFIKMKMEFNLRIKQSNYADMNITFENLFYIIDELNIEEDIDNKYLLISRKKSFVKMYGSRKLFRYFEEYCKFMNNLQKEKENSYKKEQENVLESKEYKRIKKKLLDRINKELYR